MMLKSTALTTLLLLAGTTLASADPVAANGYALRLVTASPAGDTAADSIAVVGSSFYVGYGDHHAPDGSDGLSSTIVQYSAQTGAVINSTSVLGHNDGLRLNPYTGQLWAIQNEDANPNLVILNPSSLAQVGSAVSIPTPHTGGYDDVAFSGGKAYLTASNPVVDAQGNSTGRPALVQFSLPASGTTGMVTPVLSGAGIATNVNTGAATTLNLTDPDGVTTTPNGSIQFASQGDSTLITVSNPGAANQTASVLSAGAQLDDIAYPTNGQGTLLFTDATTSDVYGLTGNFDPNSAYTAVSFPDGSANAGTALAALDLTTGALTPLVTGVNPGGLAFLNATAVPEPGSFAILGAGLLALWRRRRV